MTLYAVFAEALTHNCSSICPLDKPASRSDLEEDPLFGDDVSPDSRLSGSDWLSSSPPMSPDHSRCDGKTEVHKIVNRYRQSCDCMSNQSLVTMVVTVK